MQAVDYIDQATRNREWLFNRMAGRFEGWAISDDGRDKDVPLNELDYFAIRVLSEAAKNKKSIALAIPRVVNGIALSLVSYVTVNRFVASERKGVDALALMFDGFKPIPIDNQAPIVVITKRRELRDLYTSSSLRFNSQRFFFKDFPILRIKRSGELTNLIASSQREKFNVPPVVFYHLDNIDEVPKEIIGGFVIAELDSLNTFSTLRSFKDILDKIKPSGAIAITNLFSSTNLEFLSSNGFEILPVKPELLPRHNGVAPDFPSFASALYREYPEIDFSIKAVNAEAIDNKIALIHNRLNDLSKQSNGNLPNVFYKARTLLSILRSLAVSIDELESRRKANPSSKSIKYILKRTFTDYYIDFGESEAAFKPIWGSLATEFFELYEMLRTSNPKSEKLLEILGSENESEKKTIVVSDQIQVELLKRVVESSQLSQESKDSIDIKTIGQINRYTLQTDKLIATGIWQTKFDSAIINSQPTDISILCYKNELPLIKGFLHRLNAEDSLPIDYENYELLEDVEREKTIEVSDWMNISERTKKQLDSYKPFSEEEEPQEELPGVYFDELTSLVEHADDEPGEFLIVSSPRGETFALRCHQNVLVYRDKDQSVARIDAEAIKQGDQLLTLSHERNYEIFSELAVRLKDLSQADFEIIGVWEKAIANLNKTKNEDGYDIIFRMLDMLGCKRTRLTVKQWLGGDTLAPISPDDIGYILRASGARDAASAPLIDVEINKVRRFNRELGKKIHKKIVNAVSGNDSAKQSVLDIELDEIIDLIELFEVDEMSEVIGSNKGFTELMVLR